MSAGAALRGGLVVLALVACASAAPRWLSAARVLETRREAQRAAEYGALAQASALLTQASNARPRDPRLAAAAGDAARAWAAWGGGPAALQEATVLLRRAAAGDPTDSASLARLADVRDRAGDPMGAWDALARALTLDPHNVDHLNHAAALLDALGHPAAAADHRARARRAQTP